MSRALITRDVPLESYSQNQYPPLQLYEVLILPYSCLPQSKLSVNGQRLQPPDLDHELDN